MESESVSTRPNTTIGVYGSKKTVSIGHPNVGVKRSTQTTSTRTTQTTQREIGMYSNMTEKARVWL